MRRNKKKVNIKRQLARKQRQENRVSAEGLEESNKQQNDGKSQNGVSIPEGNTTPAVPKFLYDEIREENKKLILRINELEQELQNLKRISVSNKNQEEAIARFKQELIEKEDLIQLLESTISEPRRKNLFDKE